MKQWWMASLAMTLVLVLSACGGQPAPQQSSAPAAPAADAAPAPVDTPAAAVQAAPAPAPAPEVVATPAAENAAEIAAAQVAAVTPGGKPKITSPEPVFDFGTKDEDEEVVHEFIIKNEGDAVLNIGDVKSSCGCTVAALEKKNLEPGEQTTVKATFKLKGKQGDQNKPVTITSNDPENPTFQVRLTGKVTTSIAVDPRFINFDKIDDDAVHTKTVKLSSGKEGYTFKITNAELNMPKFKATVRTIQEGTEYEIEVSNAEPLTTSGPVSGNLAVHTDNPKNPVVNVGVVAQVVGPIQVSPSQISLRFSEEAGKTSTQIITVSPGRVKNFNITEVVAPLASMKADLESRGEGKFSIKLSDMPLDDTLDGKDLIIRTDISEAKEITVPFRVIKARLPSGLNLSGSAAEIAPPQVPTPPPAPAQ